jgi:hypothetical protein
LLAYNSEWYRAAEKARVRGCRVELGRATTAAARFYGVNDVAWRQQLLDGSLVDAKAIARDAARVAARLARGRTIRITHANGTDLALKLAGRKPVIDDGIVDAEDVRRGNNMTSIPAGAVYVSVDERSAVGQIIANRTSFPSWAPLKGGRWTMTDNRLAQFEYESGGEQFAEHYEKAATGKEAPVLEDFERGAILFGVGSNSSFGGKNRVPFQAWLGLGGAHVEVDGKPIIADGEIL